MKRTFSNCKNSISNQDKLKRGYQMEATVSIRTNTENLYIYNFVVIYLLATFHLFTAQPDMKHSLLTSKNQANFFII